MSVQVLRQGTTPDRALARLGLDGPHQFGDVGDADQQYLVSGANEYRVGYHAADREALGVEPVDDHGIGGAQCSDTVARRGR